MESEKKKTTQELKHLGFIRFAVINVIFCVSNLYEYGKIKSGPLRSTVGILEGVVSSVIGPVYEKFKGVPDDLLVFVDVKVDEAKTKFDKHAPSLAKQAASHAHHVARKATQTAQTIVNKAQDEGPRAAVDYAASESKQFIVTKSVEVWFGLNKVQPFHVVAEKVVPVAAHWSEKYNRFIKDKTHKGYSALRYLPLVPIEEIEKSFKKSEAGKEENGVVQVEQEVN